MPNPFADWGRMYHANRQFLQAQGRPSSFFGQIADTPNRIHDAAEAMESGVRMMRHAELLNGAGVRAVVAVEGTWEIGSYLNLSPVLRIKGRVERDDGAAPYVAVFDEVVAHLHSARVRPGARIVVFVDSRDPVDMAIDWIGTAQVS